MNYLSETDQRQAVRDAFDKPAGIDRSAPIDPILRRPVVEQMTGLARSTIYARMKAGTFPSPVRLGPNSIGWRQSDIAEWLASREVV